MRTKYLEGIDVAQTINSLQPKSLIILDSSQGEIQINNTITMKDGQALTINKKQLVFLINRFIHFRLCKTWLIAFVMAISSVRNNIYDDTFGKLISKFWVLDAKMRQHSKCKSVRAHIGSYF